jgi:hypothetical protein
MAEDFPNVIVFLLNSTGKFRSVNIRDFTDDEDILCEFNRKDNWSVQEYFNSIQLNFPTTPFILIFGKMGGRGMSCRSEVDKFKDVSQIIYMNAFIYSCTRNKEADEMIQSAGRIFGRYPGIKHDLYLMCPTFVKENITKHIDLINKNNVSVSTSTKKEPHLSVNTMDDIRLNKICSKRKTDRKNWYKASDGKVCTNQWHHEEYERALKNGLIEYVRRAEIKGIAKKIIDILTANPWKTAEEIYTIGGDWGLTTATPVASIRTRLFLMINDGLLEKKDNPFKYNIKA